MDICLPIVIAIWKLPRYQSGSDTDSIEKQDAQQSRDWENAIVGNRLFPYPGNGERTKMGLAPIDLPFKVDCNKVSPVLARMQRSCDIGENLIVWPISSGPETSPRVADANT